MNSKRVHVVPINDPKMHVEVGTYCHCKPRTQNEGSGTVVIHNAYDGREFYEQEPSEVYGDDGSPAVPWNGHPMEIRLKTA